MNPRVTLLCGPAGAGKTQRIISEYIQHSHRHGDDGVALIVPTSRCAAKVSQEIVRRSPRQGLYDPRIFTFPTLAETLLDANHKPVRRISAFQQRLILSEVICRRAREGAFPYLGAVSQFQGFVGAVGSVIDELKRAAVDPAQFRRIARAALPDHPANEDVASIYEAYQRHLTDRRLYDDPGAFWEARDLLRDGQRRPLEHMSLLLVDGFDEFTTTQLEVLELLCAQAQRCLISLCLEQGRREQLFAVTGRSRRKLLERLPGAREEWLAAPGAATALQGLAGRIFDAPLQPGLVDDGTVRMLGAPGVRSEVREIARRVKQLVLDGCPPDEIAIVLRSPDRYDLAIREVFAEYGLPFEAGRGEPLAARPAVQAILDILDVLAGGYRRQDVAKLLGNSYVCAEGLVGAQAFPSPDRFEHIALKARILGGKQSWARQLHLLGKRLDEELRRALHRQATDEDDDPPRDETSIKDDIATLEHCVELFGALAALLEPLREARGLPEFVGALGVAVDGLGIVRSAARRGAEVRETARDLSALQMLFAGLVEAAEAPEELGAGVGIDVARFLPEVRELTTSLHLPAPRGGPAGVHVLDVYEARQLSHRHVFIPGLTEGVFPQARRQDPFYHDAARVRLSAEGTVLEARLPQQSEESLLLHSALAGATERVWLSYPTSDAKGQPSVRSHYVEELLRHFSEPPRLHLHKLSQVTPAAGDTRCVRELAEAALHGLWRSPAVDGEQTAAQAAAVEALRVSDPELLQRAMQCAAVEDQRDSAAPPGPHDGALTDPAAHALLRSQFGPSHRYSASQLGQYGQCPMAFFLHRVLGLEALEEPTEDPQALDIGLIVHHVLRRFFARRLPRTDKWRPLDDEEAQQEARGLLAMVDEEFARWLADGLVPNQKLWELTRDAVRQDMRALLQFEAQANAGDKVGPRVPWAVELDYGRAADVSVTDGDRALLVQGRIDRIDIIPDRDPIQFVVLDYKTGSGKGPAAITKGIDFQLPLYCLAAQQMAFEGAPAEPAAWAYYRARRPVGLKGRAGRGSRQAIPELLDCARQHMLDYVDGIHNGQFIVLPRDCTEYCDFRGMCRHNVHRMSRKMPK